MLDGVKRRIVEWLSPPLLVERFARTSPKTTGGDTFNLGEKSWAERCRKYDNIFNIQSLAKAQTLTIAGQILSNDIFLEARMRDGEPYPRAEDAVGKCEELNDDLALNLQVFDTAVNLVKYGSHFMEKTFTPTFNVRTLPKIEMLEPYKQNPIGDITVWRLPHSMYSSQFHEFNVPNDIVQFHWNPTTSSWPYGTSMYAGLDTEFDTLRQLELDIQTHMHGTAHPKEVVGIGDKDYRPNSTAVGELRGQFRQWGPGEVLLTNYPVKGVQMGVINREIGNLSVVLDFLKDQTTDGLMMPPISRQYNSTNASSQEMTDWAQANLIIPMRRLIGRVIEREIYRPYLMSMGYSVRVCPLVRWEPPDMNREEDGLYYSSLVMSKIMPPRMAAEELGLDMDAWDKWYAEELTRQEEQFNQQQQQAQQKQPGQVFKQGSREWLIQERVTPTMRSTPFNYSEKP